MRDNYKRNLLIGFGASLVILIVSSTASFISIQNLLTSTEWVNHTHQIIIEMDGIRSAMVDAETGQRGYLLAGDDRFLEPYRDSEVRAKSAFSRVKMLTADNPEQQQNLEELDALITERFRLLELSVSAKRNDEPIKKENLQSGRESMDKIRALIERMEELERDLLKTRTSEMDRFSSFTPWLIVAAAIIALLITVMFYTRVNGDFEQRIALQQELVEKDGDISRRIQIIQGIADKVAQGNYDIRVTDQQSDSLGSVAVSLNKMAGALATSFNQLSDNEWKQTGLAGLNDTMLGDKTLEALTRQVIEYLATYTQSHAGVLYLRERDELEASASFAYLPDKLRQRLKVGEGLVGQSIMNGKVLELKDIPEGNISISFVAGEARPSHIISIPLLDGYNIKGAVELATLRSFSERDIEFLKASAHNIGVAISSAQNRKRLQELLEETQAQSEELRTQHSELENLNSELEVQAEKLQASEEELKVQQEELRQANQELEERSRLLEERNQLITERNVEIQTKAEQLTQSARYKSEFLANMSHELRTPLNSILLLSRLLSENQDRNLSTDQVEYARVIQSSGNGLLSLIDEILDLSKIESGKMQLEYEPLSINEVVSDMNALFTAVAQDKKIEFITHLQPVLPEVLESDKLRLEQILRNLISNAIKFTAQGSVTLEIGATAEDPAWWKFVVRDTGIGIAADKQQMVFEAFQQADGSTRRKYGGTGLGLSISRELAKLLGGEIQLRSEEGKGSEFTVVIPSTRAAAIKRTKQESYRDEPVPALVREGAAPPKKLYISESIPESIPDDRDSLRQGEKSILIVEDDVNFAKALLDYTRTRGYKGVVAVRGDEGLSLAKELLPVGILLDIQLPIKSGWEVMSELKEDTRTRHIPVHIMSSHEVKRESLMKGAVDFINKPVAFEKMGDVFQKIEYVLTHHPKKVLIVEENPKHAKALAYFLETFDLNLEIKNDVHDAVQSLRDQRTDCVILDMGIPDQKAYETLEEVKKTPGLENLPIIIFTGKSLSQPEQLRIKQYADSIVVKTANSYKRILDEVSLFLHLMEKEDKEKAAPSRYHKLGALDEVLRNKTVLVADDDMRNIFSLTKALEQYQMNVITAVDGKDALRQLHAHPDTDIVLMDMMMPEMDGYESISAIRRDPLLKDIPVLAVTAKAMTGDRIKCINAGASDYISKPVDIDQLLSLLRVWLYEKGRK
ncbi:response regulator [Parachryseolinea silvisoli]|uniref:response regulator n=1 Tax=Parachryseolinea silvisoli TaxID=2873601 RepID=UPI002265E5F0|nr:response regulator [Parachryseolinea silvisoli]MCD9014921.1 response regulator [Parachryseolinea silvisoli]